MKCHSHNAECLPKQAICFLCQDGSAAIEHDLISQEYEVMARHVQRGIRGVRTRKQYQKLLKSRGLTDDVTHKELVNCTLDDNKRERVKEQKIQAFTDRITPALQERVARQRQPGYAQHMESRFRQAMAHEQALAQHRRG
jgi:hypothetical protein